MKSKLELVRNSRIITISVESENPEMAMALANCYLKVIKSESEKENIERCNEAVKQIADQAVNCRKEWNKKNTELLEYKTKEKIDTLNSERDTLQISLQKVTTSLAELEGKETLLDEWEKLLTEVKSLNSPFTKGLRGNNQAALLPDVGLKEFFGNEKSITIAIRRRDCRI